MIEGGAIDWAVACQPDRPHDRRGAGDFNKAVDAVIAWVQKYSNWNETLLIVTGDHETGNLWGPGSGIVNGVAHYTPVVNNGKGNVPGVQWNSGEHTNQLDPALCQGRCRPVCSRPMCAASDPVRGAYIDNTDLADLLFRAMQ